MKVLGVISLVITCVVARGSGPYLPRGWKPEGPSFYLPSEVSKPLKEPVKEIIFGESEASGSDFLLEYGPPKIQEISQDVSQQALPDVVNTQLFIETVVENTDSKQDTNRVSEVTEQKFEVNAEIKTAGEPLLIKESQSVNAAESVEKTEANNTKENDKTSILANDIESGNAVDKFGYHIVEPTIDVSVTATELITNTEVDNTKVNDETTTLANAIESDNVVDEFGYHLVEPTITDLVSATESIVNTEVDNTKVNDETTALTSAIRTENVTAKNIYLEESTAPVEVKTEKVKIESKDQLPNQIHEGDTIVVGGETEQLIKEQQESIQSLQVDKSEITAPIQVTNEVKQSSIDASQQTELSTEKQSGTILTQQANLDVITAVEEKVKTIEKDLKRTENVVENIPELISTVYKDVKSQQTETIQEIPAIVQELFGSLDQAPEGFLEYGPPGFTEYGPPKEDLKGNTIEESISENSEVRKRRFSPKFRSSRKSQQ